MESERILNTKRNIVMGTLAKLVNLLFPLAINAIIIKKLGIEYQGLSSLFACILQVLSLAELGIGSAMVFSMYEPIACHDVPKVCALLRLYRKIYLIIGCVIFAAGLCCMPFLTLFVAGDVPADTNIYILFLISLFNTSISFFLFAYREALFQASQRTDIRDTIAMILDIILSIAKILVLIILADYYIFCLLIPLFTIINNIVTALVTRKKYPEYRCAGTVSKEERLDISRRVSGLFINRFCDVICNSFDSIIISSFLGLEMLGKYNNYFYLMNALMMLLAILVNSAIPSMGNSVVLETQKKNYDDFCTLQFGYSWLTGWVAVSLLGIYQTFIKFWVGEDMLLMMPLPVLMCVYLYVVKSGEVFMAYRQAAGIWSHDKIRPVFEALLNLGLNIWFVKMWGVVGVVLSTILTLGLIRLTWGSWYLFNEYFRDYSHGRYLLRMCYYTVITVAAGIANFALCELIPIEGFLGLVIRGGICITVPNIIFIVSYYRLPEFKKAVKLGKSLLKREW